MRRNRVTTGDAFYYSWLLRIPYELQRPFQPTHESMAALQLSRDRPIHDLAADLRRAFSGNTVRGASMRIARCWHPSTACCASSPPPDG